MRPPVALTIHSDTYTERTPMAEPNPQVTYDIRDLLDKIGVQILESAKDVKMEVARLAGLIETKASKESVEALSHTVTELDLRLTDKINLVAAQQGETRGFSKGTMALLAIAVPSFVAIIVAVIYLVSGGH